jgi:hypothetical protein
MPRGIYKRKKKKLTIKTPPKGRHYNRVVMDDIVSTPLASSNQYNLNQASSIDYEKLYRDLKKDMTIQRYQFLNDFMKSVATINDAIAHIIGEVGGGRL